MSAKLPYSLADENPDLQKQIGCMSGIFLLFDRRLFLSGGRIRSHNQKRLPPPGHTDNNGKEPNSITQKAIEKDLEKGEKEKRRLSVAAPTTSSSSSSCSSTFSSVDCSKTAQREPSFSEHTIFPRNSSQIPATKHPNSSSHLGQQSLGLRHVVKDSICKETQELSVQTTTKAKGVSRVAKNVDSPRPPKDAPRSSYDERASRVKWKSATNPKELPRLSLDSRERSTRKSAHGSLPNYLFDDLKHGNCSSSQTLDPHQELGSNKRLSSVVGKLMGLEAFPNSNEPSREIKCCSDENLDTMSTSSRKADESTYNKAIGSAKSRVPLEPAPWKQPERNRGSHVKAQNTSSSVYREMEERVTKLEFKRSSKNLRALKQILETMGKTKKRLENGNEDHASYLDPQTSNHGSNYLNGQKFTPIYKKGHLKKLESSVATTITAKDVQKPINSGHSAISAEGISGLCKLHTRASVDIRQDSLGNRKAKDLNTRRKYFLEPSLLPVNSMDKSSGSRTFKSTRMSKAPQPINGGNPASSETSSTTVSPRLQQKKQSPSSEASSTTVSPRLQQKKQSQPTTPTLDSSRAKGHLSIPQTVSSSRSRKFKPKSSNLQQGDDPLSERRHLSHQGDAVSEQSDSNLSLGSQCDIEVTSTDRSKKINDLYQHKPQKNEVAARSNKDGSNGERTIATLEQPSPVSVLDTTFYGEESPSPIKKISNGFKDEETLNSDEAEWSLVDQDHSPNSKRPSLSPQFDLKKFESIKYLVHKLRQVNSKHDEVSTDHIASLCETTNPQHRYITEILLASGILLKDLGSSSTIIQLHQSGHLINPNLFLVLEQTKGGINQSTLSEKFHRKLIFDTVNEILFCKFNSAGFYDPWISPNKTGVRNLDGRKLLKELCAEIDHLQADSECSSGDEDDGLISILREGMMHHTQYWEDYHMELPGVVLDIERRIFKDLIAEIVSCKAARLQNWPTKHCKQLFSM